MVYSDVSPYIKRMKRKNEWCHFDYDKAKKYTYLGAVFISALFFLVFFICGYYILFDIISLSYFYIYIVIILLVIIYLGYMTKRNWMRGVGYFKNSYSILLDYDNDLMNQIVYKVTTYLKSANIKYDIIGLDQLNIPNSKLTIPIIIISKSENSYQLFGIIGNTDNTMTITIFTEEFPNKNDAIELKKMIWPDTV